MADWHPNAIRAVGRHAGAHASDAGWKIIHHTTEGSSAAGAIAAYRGHGGWPHFTAEWTGSRLRLYQHLPLSVAARALKNGPEAGETNRARAVQIEHVGFAATSESWPKARYAAIAALCRWIEAQTGCPAETLPGTVWGTDRPPRLSGSAFHRGRGHAAHQHVPGNDHWDWGQGNIALVLDEDDDARRTLKDGMTGADVEAFQQAVNKFIRRYCKCRTNRRGLTVDGVVGPKTLESGKWAAYLLGMPAKHDLTKYVQVRVRHTEKRTKAQVAKGGLRRRIHCNCK
jgi:hypothetical protein